MKFPFDMAISCHIFRFNHRNLKDVMFSNSCRNQGQPACFPQKQPSWIGWCLGWVETYDYSGGMKILLPAVFMSYQGFDPLSGHVWSPLSKGQNDSQELSAPVLRKEKILPQVGRPRWVAPLAPLDGKYKVQIWFWIGLGTWTQYSWKKGRLRIERWGCK